MAVPKKKMSKSRRDSRKSYLKKKVKSCNSFRFYALFSVENIIDITNTKFFDLNIKGNIILDEYKALRSEKDQLIFITRNLKREDRSKNINFDLLFVSVGKYWFFLGHCVNYHTVLVDNFNFFEIPSLKVRIKRFLFLIWKDDNEIIIGSVSLSAIMIPSVAILKNGAIRNFVDYINSPAEKNLQKGSKIILTFQNPPRPIDCPKYLDYLRGRNRTAEIFDQFKNWGKNEILKKHYPVASNVDNSCLSWIFKPIFSVLVLSVVGLGVVGFFYRSEILASISLNFSRFMLKLRNLMNKVKVVFPNKLNTNVIKSPFKVANVIKEEGEFLIIGGSKLDVFRMEEFLTKKLCEDILNNKYELLDSINKSMNRRLDFNRSLPDIQSIAPDFHFEIKIIDSLSMVNDSQIFGEINILLKRNYHFDPKCYTEIVCGTPYSCDPYIYYTWEKYSFSIDGLALESGFDPSFVISRSNDVTFKKFGMHTREVEPFCHLEKRLSNLNLPTSYNTSDYEIFSQAHVELWFRQLNDYFALKHWPPYFQEIIKLDLANGFEATLYFRNYHKYRLLLRDLKAKYNNPVVATSIDPQTKLPNWMSGGTKINTVNPVKQRYYGIHKFSGEITTFEYPFKRGEIPKTISFDYTSIDPTGWPQ
jgi:hypothetical protein